MDFCGLVVLVGFHTSRYIYMCGYTHIYTYTYTQKWQFFFCFLFRVCLLRSGNIYKEQIVWWRSWCFPRISGLKSETRSFNWFCLPPNGWCCWWKNSRSIRCLFSVLPMACVSHDIHWSGCCNIPPPGPQVKTIIAGQPTPQQPRTPLCNKGL